MTIERLSNTVLTSGTTVSFKALIKTATVKTAKNRADYIIMELCDNAKSVTCKFWNATNAMQNDLIVGNVIEVIASAETYQDKLSLIGKSYGIIGEKAGEYLEIVENLNDYFEIIEDAIAALDPDKLCAKIVKSLLTPDVLERNKYATAARHQHHYVAGGWAMHTANMIRIAKQIAPIYGLDITTVISAILLHDYGKFRELELNLETGITRYTTESSLLGHITICISEIDKVISQIDENLTYTEEAALFKHIILSHHGRREWGSPVEPMTPEALFVHNLDMIDSGMDRIIRALDGLDAGEFLYNTNTAVYKPTEKG